MNEACRLVDADGLAIDSIEWRASKAGPELLSLARRRAEASGRVIEVGEQALLAIGIAARLQFPAGFGAAGATEQASELLAEMATDGADDGPVPVALGALPFDASRPSSLVIPRLLVSSDARHGDFAITVGAHLSLDALTDAPVGAESASPDAFTISPAHGQSDYRDRVAAAVAAIGRGEVDKVVLARELFVDADRPFHQAELIARLRQRHPTCAVFALDGFIGASPELLVSRHGELALARPLAGTVPRGHDEEDDHARARALMDSQKERAEHSFVVDDVVGVLSRHAKAIDVPPQPELVSLANVIHLGTPIRAELRRDSDAGLPTALELMGELHPTAAIGGVPRAAALAYLNEHEGFERGNYGGPVGWIDAHGDGSFWIGIRSAQIAGTRARLVAGGGIVAGSDPDAEFAETTAKFEALLAAFTTS